MNAFLSERFSEIFASLFSDPTTKQVTKAKIFSTGGVGMIKKSLYHIKLSVIYISDNIWVTI